jgi:prolyl oligopeptidase
MKLKTFMPYLLLGLVSMSLYAKQNNSHDEYLWLENIDSPKSMQWVNNTNKITDDKLKTNPLYNELYTQALSILNAKNRLPAVSQNGKWLYNFWQDNSNPRGIYRRTTLDELKKPKPNWETVLDMDAYSKQHNLKYDYHGMSCLPPDDVTCLVSLSPSGGDAVVIREFSLKSKGFIKNGFTIPLAKSRATWIDKDTLYIATDFGKESMSNSGYPRIIKNWKRGTPLSEAKTIFTADKKSMSASAFRVKNDSTSIDIITESTSFWSSKKYQIHKGKITPLKLPKSSIISGTYQDKLVISLKEHWAFNKVNYIQGEVLLIDPSLLRGQKGSIESIIRPDTKTVVESIKTSKYGILVTTLQDVKAKLFYYQKQKNGNWNMQNIVFPKNGALKVTSIDETSGNFFVEYESFITPPSLYHVSHKTLIPELIKQQDESFNGSQFKVEQYFSQSLDGTHVPYFIVMNKNTKFDGSNPTHIFSYGGFRNSLTPSYSGSYEALSGAYGKLWLERGGVFVLANIRGGGEYGPAWHAAALLKNRHKSFEDFEAIANDLFKRKITSAKHLGIEGRSNGGLLVTATMTRHPELYSAVVCGAPLIDMKRYNKLLAGASWMGEYGNPDEADTWQYLKTYSPYQNVKTDVKYPPIFFYTSTRDDRVHPGHARKMAAKLIDLGNNVDYYENIEGGHHGFSTNEQLAHRLALSYTHLWSHLK